MQKLNKNWNIMYSMTCKPLIYIYAPYTIYYFFNKFLLKLINKFTLQGLKIKMFKYIILSLQWFSRFYKNMDQIFSLNYLFYYLLLKNNYAHIFKLIKKNSAKKQFYEYQRFFLTANQRQWSFVFYFKSLIAMYDICKLKFRFCYFLYDTYKNFNASAFKQWLLFIK